MAIEHVSPEQKSSLRKLHTLPDSVKVEVYLGNLAGPSMAVQFNRDLTLYGMWEALLYVEAYEQEGKYKQGTADRACNLALESLGMMS